ncbi:unnamed protein product, partial [Polarella glacialis]
VADLAGSTLSQLTKSQGNCDGRASSPQVDVVLEETELGQELQPLRLITDSSNKSPCLAHVAAKGPGELSAARLQCGAATQWENRTYQLQEINFYAPSRTMVAGRRLTMEAQLVHRTPQGHALVISQLFLIGKRNEFLQNLFGDPPAKQQ